MTHHMPLIHMPYTIARTGRSIASAALRVACGVGVLLALSDGEESGELKAAECWWL